MTAGPQPPFLAPTLGTRRRRCSISRCPMAVLVGSVDAAGDTWEKLENLTNC